MTYAARRCLQNGCLHPEPSLSSPEVVVHQKAACERLSFYVRRVNMPPNTCFPVFVAVQLHEMPAQGDRQRRRPAALYVLPLSHRPISLGYGSLRGRLRAASFFLLLLRAFYDEAAALAL